MQNKKYKSAIAEIHYNAEIVYINYTTLEFSLAEVKVLVEDLWREFEEAIPMRILSDISGQQTPSKEVRDYLASPDVVKNLKANAIVASSIFAKIAGNLFMTISRPSVPTKIFSNMATAEAWLRTFP